MQNRERTKNISVTKTALHKSFAFLGLTKVLFRGILGIGRRGDRGQQFGDWGRGDRGQQFGDWEEGGQGAECEVGGGGGNHTEEGV